MCDNVRSRLLKVGRWIAAEHPDVADPAAWTRKACAAWVAAVDRMNVGDYVHRPDSRSTSASRLRPRPRTLPESIQPA